MQGQRRVGFVQGEESLSAWPGRVCRVVRGGEVCEINWAWGLGAL